MAKKLTIKDIAALAGVGKSTVSRVLNQDSKVSAETREKIQAIIQAHNFTPSQSARAMRGQGNPMIGIIVTRLSSNAENQALSAMLPLLYAANCEPIIVESQMEMHRLQEHLKFFQQRRVDGVILFAFSDLEEQNLQGWEKKLVVIARHYPQFSCVYYDEQRAVTLLLEKLLQQGHQKIAYLGVQESDMTTGYLRHQAYLRFCQDHQLTPNAVLGKLSYDSAYQLASAVDFSQISAIVCATDTLAIGVVKWLQEHQITHISVAGIGNNPLLRFLFPQTLSVDLGFTTAGKQAVKQLFCLLKKGEIKASCIDCGVV
ncbi:trehalose operon repressor TreR [Avibacterium sp. 21-594]|uniref:trehalose operon repressor TreR n=1 Tax=Avibacterium sp. 21-594 TaxID=2911535 RepID=UPI002246621B|nr:trehalose operon repressor TreR [Avibacterium sp. 21-594]MCW9714636.1 trehalose operon repressor TreR [Avibacterium sp. 21-594]